MAGRNGIIRSLVIGPNGAADGKEHQTERQCPGVAGVLPPEAVNKLTHCGVPLTPNPSPALGRGEPSIFNFSRAFSRAGGRGAGSFPESELPHGFSGSNV